MTPRPVTLQISLAPSDYGHARVLLEHQVRAWGGQVAEVLLCVDFHRSSGRFSSRWNEGKERILELAKSVEAARVLAVDYSDSSMERVSAEFFGGRRVPAKDFRGGPYFSYFFGMSQAQHRYVLHTDSDMFFGGGSQTWIEEALASFERRSDVLFAGPLPGPPAPDGRLHSQQGEPDADEPYAFRLDGMSTRLFLTDRQRFHERIGALRPRRPRALRNTIKALVEGNPPEDLPEQLFADAMRAKGLVRREFLGRAPGMWSLHPPYRCPDFFNRLPELVRRVESADIPEAQRGDHDMNASMVDWSEAIAELARNRWWKRPWRRN
jgi:hypothetical protein